MNQLASLFVDDALELLIKYKMMEKKTLASFSLKEKEILKNINSINSWINFKGKYKNLVNAIKAECIGRGPNEKLKNELIDLIKKNIRFWSRK